MLSYDIVLFLTDDIHSIMFNLLFLVHDFLVYFMICLTKLIIDFAEI